MIHRVLVEHREVVGGITESFEWADEVWLCLARADLSAGSGVVWQAVLHNVSKIQAVVLGVRHDRPDPGVISALDRHGVLRVATGDPLLMRANIYYFKRAGDARVVIGSADLTAGTLDRSISSNVYAEGPDSHEFFCGVRRLRDRCLEVARLPMATDLQNLQSSVNDAPPTSVPVASTLANIGINGHLSAITSPEQIAEYIAVLSGALNCPLRSGDGAWAEVGGVSVRIVDETSAYVVQCVRGGPPKGGTFELGFRIQKAGTSPRIGGLFARSGDSRVYLVHRGDTRIDAKIRREEFWRSTRCRPAALREIASDDEEEETRVAIVCEPESPEGPMHFAAFVAELLRVRELDPDVIPEDEEVGDSPDFLALDDDDRAARVWASLLGNGSTERDEAVRLVAKDLRESGEAKFARLRSGGELYVAIDQAIAMGIRLGKFDRPQRGYVRAVLEDPPPGIWRYCAMQALPEAGVPMDREEATRRIAEFAADAFGVQFQRLRRGGRIETAVKSALNSCIRRGWLDGAGKSWVCRRANLDELDFA